MQFGAEGGPHQLSHRCYGCYICIQRYEILSNARLISVPPVMTRINNSRLLLLLDFEEEEEVLVQDRDYCDRYFLSYLHCDITYYYMEATMWVIFV